MAPLSYLCTGVIFLSDARAVIHLLAFVLDYCPG
jgi:hypothetical protein